jgi:hypothetical protein
VGALNRHVKDCHPLNEADKKCPTCAKAFTSIRGRDQHVEIGCPQERNKLWSPSNVTSSEKKNQRHVQCKNKLSDRSQRLVAMFKEYLESGCSSPFMLARGKRKLSESSVETYSYHLRDFLDFFDVSCHCF